jgi:hypothetical protein
MILGCFGIIQTSGNKMERFHSVELAFLANIVLDCFLKRTSLLVRSVGDELEKFLTLTHRQVLKLFTEGFNA